MTERSRDLHNGVSADIQADSETDSNTTSQSDAATPPARLRWVLSSAFHAATWFVLRLAGPALRPADLAALRCCLSRAAPPLRPRDPEWAAAADEVELLLTLALRRQRAVAVRRLQRQQPHLGDPTLALERLQRLRIPLDARPHAGHKRQRSAGDGESEAAVSLVRADTVARAVSQGREAAAAAVGEALDVIPARELRGFAAALQEWCRLRGLAATAAEHALQVSADDAGEASAPPPPPTHTARKSAVPLRKTEVVEFILARRYAALPSMDAEESAVFVSHWEALVGDVVLVSSRAREVLSNLRVLFHALHSCMGAGSPLGALGTAATAGVTPPPADYYWATRQLLAPEQLWLAAACPPAYVSAVAALGCLVPPWWSVPKACETHKAVCLCLFDGPAALDEFLAARRLLLELHEMTEPRTATQTQRACCKNAEFLTRTAANVLRGAKERGAAAAGGSLSRLLARQGLAAEHLLQFTATYQWYACLEVLLPLLQSARLVELANDCLRCLLETAVFAAEAPRDPHTRFLFYYRYVKRGEWWHRLALNWSAHQRRPEQALALLTDVRARHSEAAAAADALEALATRLASTGDGAAEVPTEELAGLVRLLPQSVQRRARVLRALWPERERPGVALAHAVAEFRLERFCRRADLLQMEHKAAALHRQLNRWTPVPKALTRLESATRPAPEMFLTAPRDATNAALWRDDAAGGGSGRLCSVEDLVLRRVLRGLNGRGAGGGGGWRGVHCEGRWIALAARALLWECYHHPHGCSPPRAAAATDDDDSGEDCCCLWLLPFQEGPLDLCTPLGFLQRRRRAVEERLRYLEGCSAAELHAAVTQHTRAWTRDDALGGAEGEDAAVGSGSEDDGGGGGGEDAPPIAGEPAPAVTGTAPSAEPDDYLRVSVGTLPLAEIVCCAPRGALVALLRLLYASPLEEGYYPKFSGFPDLILWNAQRVTTSEETAAAGACAALRLIEVKSPSDVLSTKQLVVNDALLRCGFDVAVAHVQDSPAQSAPSPSRAAALRRARVKK